MTDSPVSQFLAGSCWLRVQLALVQQQPGCADTRPSRSGSSGINPSRVDMLHWVLLLRSPWKAVKSSLLGITVLLHQSGRDRQRCVLFQQLHWRRGGLHQSSKWRERRHAGNLASLGPIFRAPMENFTMFAHGLDLAVPELGGPNSRSARDVGARALSLGSGADRRRRYGLRPSFLRPPVQPASIRSGLPLYTR